MNEFLLLTNTVNEFRVAYPELIAQWERQIEYENCHPDLYFCLTLMDDFPYLDASLRFIDYRIDFAVNAHIVPSHLQREFIEFGYNGNLALELANHEIRLTYQALNVSGTIAEDPKIKVHYYVLTDVHFSNF